MKKLLGLILIAFPFAVFAQGQCPVPDGCYVDRITYEILDVEGTVVDKTVYDRLLPISYEDAMLLKYARMIPLSKGSARTAIKLMETNNNIKAYVKGLSAP